MHSINFWCALSLMYCTWWTSRHALLSEPTLPHSVHDSVTRTELRNRALRLTRDFSGRWGKNGRELWNGDKWLAIEPCEYIRLKSISLATTPSWTPKGVVASQESENELLILLTFTRWGLYSPFLFKSTLWRQLKSKLLISMEFYNIKWFFVKCPCGMEYAKPICFLLLNWEACDCALLIWG